MESSQPKNFVDKPHRLLHLDFLRIIAIWLVIFNHTSWRGFMLFSVSRESVLFPFYLFVSIFCKIAVPIFFMVSGALLLQREESIKTLYKKRIAKFIIVLILISFVYFWHQGRLVAAFNLKESLTEIYRSNVAVGLWYLYSYIGILVMLPLLRALVRGMQKKDYFYWAAAFLVLTGIIPIVQYRISGGQLSLNGSFSVPLIVSSNIFFFVMGHFFENVLDKNDLKWKYILIGAVISLISIGICSYMTVYAAGITGDWTEAGCQNFHSTLILFPTFTVYAFAKKLFFCRNKIDGIQAKILTELGKCTFGIYLLEEIMRHRLEWIFVRLQPLIRVFPACCVWVTICFLSGFAIVLVLRRIPGIRKLI